MKRLKYLLLVTQWGRQEGCVPQCLLQLSQGWANCFARKSQGKKNLRFCSQMVCDSGNTSASTYEQRPMACSLLTLGEGFLSKICGEATTHFSASTCYCLPCKSTGVVASASWRPTVCLLNVFLSYLKSCNVTLVKTNDTITLMPTCKYVTQYSRVVFFFFSFLS